MLSSSAFADQKALLTIPTIGEIEITAHEAQPKHKKGPFLAFETKDGVPPV